MRSSGPRKAAQDLGLKYFFAVSPCKNGHTSERYTKNRACVACNKAARALYAKENPEKIKIYNERSNKSHLKKESSRLWRAKHPKWVKERYKIWATKNGEERNAKRRLAYIPKPRKRGRDPEVPKRSGKKWREKNREFDRSRAAIWRKNNPELAASVTRAWRQKNKDKRLAAQNRRRARKKGGGGSYLPSDIREIFFAQKGRCALCGVKLSANQQIDHIVPLAKGGTSNRNNLQILCRPCNASKGAKDQIDFMQARGRLL